MTFARPTPPGQTIAFTKRCNLRMFLLKPDDKVNQALLYIFAECAKLFGIRVHALVVMSNHIHGLITDPHGVYPLFFERFFKLSAKCLNCLYGRWGALWDKTQPAVVRVLDREAAIAWATYILCNPAKAGLVDHVHHWPGVDSWRAMRSGTTLGAKRPSWFFDPDGSMPEEAWVEVEPPPAWDGTDEAWSELVGAKVTRKQQQYAAARKGRVLGRKGVLRQWRYTSPDVPEDKRRVQKRVAGRHKWARIEAILRNQDWLAAYRAARDALKAGVLDIVFPAHAWKVARQGLRVEPG